MWFNHTVRAFYEEKRNQNKIVILLKKKIKALT